MSAETYLIIWCGVVILGGVLSVSLYQRKSSGAAETIKLAVGAAGTVRRHAQPCSQRVGNVSQCRGETSR